jgi:hypothetical protein
MFSILRFSNHAARPASRSEFRRALALAPGSLALVALCVALALAKLVD